MKRSLLLLPLLLACSLAAEWQVLAPNVMTVAIGCSAANDKTVFVSGGDNGGGASILKSEDGGSTWVSLPHDPQAMYLSIEASLTSPYVVAGSIGFWKQTAVASISTDGQTFEGASYVPLFSASQSVGTSGTSVFIVGFWMDSALADPMDGVIASTDGGKTLTFHPWTGKTQARYGSFTSNGTWYISGGTWPSEETRKTFHSRQSNLFRRVSLKREHGSMSFNIKEHIESTNKNDYIAVIQKSTDGGQTFTTVFSDTGRFYFNGIHCLDEDNCWVVAEGDDGAWILKSSNGGQTWEEQSFQPAMSLIDVHMLNYSEGWAVGGEILSNTFNALFLHTTDGGKTWVREGVIANAYPNSITVPSGQRAYATAFLRNGLSSILGYF